MHTFIVPAYMESPYLEACLHSLRSQAAPSRILISTSTPFPTLESVAKTYGAELFVHSPNRGMAHDWNKGLEQINTPWVTIAHQDDVYYPNFTSELSTAMNNARDPISLVFTNYDELLDDEMRPRGRLLQIKQLLLEFAFLGRNELRSSWGKVNCLRFGNPISCPSVSLNLEQARIQFSSDVHVNMDWLAWLERARRPGSFYWIRKSLMAHRIHESSGTSEGIAAGHRAAEDLSILQTLWPHPIAKLIQKTYSIAYQSNKGR